MAFQEEEFKIGKGIKSKDEKIAGYSSWKRGYYAARFSTAYVEACYNFEKHPQAIYKVIGFAKGINAVSVARSMIDYITSRKIKKEIIDKETGELLAKEKITQQTFYNESGEELKGKEYVAKVFNEWQLQWKHAGGKTSGKGERRLATHMVFSTDRSPTKHNMPKILASVAQTMSDEFGDDGFNYVYSLHSDTDYTHVHVIINNYNTITHKKLRQDRQDFLRIRTNFANQLKVRGMSYIATLRRDRPEIQTKINAIINASIDTLEQWRKTLDTCTLSSQKSQLSGQITKKLKKYEFNKDKVKLTFKKLINNQYKVSVNMAGKPYEQILAKIAKKEMGSKDFYIDGVKDNAAVVFKHPINKIDHNIFTQAFNKELGNYKEKQNIRLANRAVNILPKLHHTIKSLDRLKISIKHSKVISLSHKRKVYAKIVDIRSKILNGEDVQKLLDSSILKTTSETESIIQEMKDFKIKIPKSNAAEKMRQAGLESFITNQKKMLDGVIGQLEGAPIGNKEFEINKKIRISGLKIMRKAKTYGDLLTASKSFKNQMAAATDVLIRHPKDEQVIKL